MRVSLHNGMTIILVTELFADGERCCPGSFDEQIPMFVADYQIRMTLDNAIGVLSVVRSTTENETGSNAHWLLRFSHTGELKVLCV